MNGDHQILGGRYEVGRLLGRGGMAEVYLGRDELLGRTVAIKVLRTDLARDATFQARFRREAQSSASLNHPEIVAVYDTGEEIVDEAGGGKLQVPFIVMEYVEGRTLKEVLAQDGPLPVDRAAEIFSGVLSALGYSHRHGIVHRDIKPGNVMLTPAGGVKVMDFGIARAVADSSATVTQANSVMGTAQYLSPEQARGEKVDARSDLYSAGCLFYELLTGRPPFVGDSPVAVAYQHVSEAPKPPSYYRSSIPAAIDEVVLRALAKQREDRYATAEAFRGELSGALASSAGSPDTVPTQAYPTVSPATAATQALGTRPTTVLGTPDGPSLLDTLGDEGPASGAPGDARPAGRKKKGRAKWYWLIGVLALLAIGGATVGLLLANRKPAVTTVQVPDVTNQSYATASTTLRDDGLKPRRVEEANPTVDPGAVVRTDPGSGRTVRTGSTVTVYVSTGPSSVTVPDVTGQSQGAARQALQDAGLEAGNANFQNDPSVPADRVISTNPAVGSSVAPHSTVDLVVSTGKVTLPDLRGQTVEDATRTLQGLRLSATIERQPTGDAEPGRVVDQNPGTGDVPQGTTVTIVVAEEPPATSPSPTDTPSPTATATATASGQAQSGQGNGNGQKKNG